MKTCLKFPTQNKFDPLHSITYQSSKSIAQGKKWGIENHKQHNNHIEGTNGGSDWANMNHHIFPISRPYKYWIYNLCRFPYFHHKSYTMVFSRKKKKFTLCHIQCVSKKDRVINKLLMVYIKIYLYLDY